METTLFLSKILGPVLFLRGIAILLDRQQVAALLEGLEPEAASTAFSVMPLFLLTASLALAVTHKDTSSPAAIILHLIAWIGILKGSLLILWPRTVLAYGRRAGNLAVLRGLSLASAGLGGYLTWFGYFRAT